MSPAFVSKSWKYACLVLIGTIDFDFLFLLFASFCWFLRCISIPLICPSVFFFFTHFLCHCYSCFEQRISSFLIFFSLSFATSLTLMHFSHHRLHHIIHSISNSQSSKVFIPSLLISCHCHCLTTYAHFLDRV